MARRTPKPGTIASIIAEHGIEAVRGVPVLDGGGGRTLFISNRLIDKIVSEAAEDDELRGDTRYAWRERLYGGESPDADMVVWIQPNTSRPLDPAFNPATASASVDLPNEDGGPSGP